MGVASSRTCHGAFQRDRRLRSRLGLSFQGVFLSVFLQGLYEDLGVGFMTKGARGLWSDALDSEQPGDAG